MPHVIVNGSKLTVRFLDVELARLKLDAANPRLHSAYLTHQLKARPSQADIEQILVALPEFADLLNAIARNEGCFQPPLVASDLRVLEGNRRVAALRVLRARPDGAQWARVTVAQFVDRLSATQEQSVRAKYHLESALPWDHLSQLAEYLALAEREGTDVLAGMLSRPERHIEPLLVAGRLVRRFSDQYPDLHAVDDLRVLVGLCGVKQIAPKVVFSRATRLLFTHTDDLRPGKQPYPVDQVLGWIAEGRFTRPFITEDGQEVRVRPEQVPAAFRQVREGGEEPLSYFHEADGSLAKALSSLVGATPVIGWQHQRALTMTRRYVDLLEKLKPIRQRESPDLYRDALNCHRRLGELLGLGRKERGHARSHHA